MESAAADGTLGSVQYMPLPRAGFNRRHREGVSPSGPAQSSKEPQTFDGHGAQDCCATTMLAAPWHNSVIL